MSQQKVINRYLVVVGGCIMGLVAGLVYGWSIYVRPICEQYGWGTDQVALMGSVMTAFFGLGTTVGGNLLPKLGSKVTSLIGALMYGLGVLVSAYVTNPILMYITYGVIAGLGTGILYNMGMFVVSAWFPDKRGVIMGVFLALFGLSLTIFSAPISNMLTSLGVRTTMTIEGIVFTVILTLIALFLMKMPPAGWHPAGYVAPASGMDENTMTSLSPSEAYKTKTFWMYILAIFLLVLPWSFINSYVTVFVTDVKALTAAQAVAIVSAMGIGSFLGRLVGGLVLNKLGNRVTYAIFCLCSVLACLMLLFTNGYTMMMIAFFLNAVGFGGRTPMYGVFSVQHFGPVNASAIYGTACFSTVFSSLLGPSITAYARNATGSYNAAIIFAMVVAVIGMLLIWFVPKETPFMKKNGVHAE